MKQLFKKNQIIITALALMIAAAGYLQFSNPGDEAKQSGNNNVYFGEADGTDGNKNVADSDGLAGEDGTGDLTIQVGSQQNDNSQSADNTEPTGDNHQIGEAVMVSTTLQGNFTTNAKLVREQRRALSKETLMGIIDNAALSDEQKQIAVETLVNLTNIAEKENAAELLLEAKGFADPIVNIVDNEVDVVINASSVTDRQIAQIEDIVTRKTGFEPKDITITAAIQED